MKTSEIAASVSQENLAELLPAITALPLTHQCHIFIRLMQKEPAAWEHPSFAAWAKDKESAILALPKELDLTQPPDESL
jgi:hypothetical protein